MGAEILRFENFELDRGAYRAAAAAGRVVRLERIPLELLFLLAGAARVNSCYARRKSSNGSGAKASSSTSTPASTPRCARLRRALHDDAERAALRGDRPRQGLPIRCAGARGGRRADESPAGTGFIRGTQARAGRVARRSGCYGGRAWAPVPAFGPTRRRQDPADGRACGVGSGAGRGYDGAGRTLQRSGRCRPVSAVRRDPGKLRRSVRKP